MLLDGHWSLFSGFGWRFGEDFATDKRQQEWRRMKTMEMMTNLFDKFIKDFDFPPLLNKDYQKLDLVYH